MSIVGERIRDRRVQIGLSQEQLAHAIGSHQKQISRYEKGENDPTAEVVIRIAKALQTTPDWLLGFDDLEEDVSKIMQVIRSVKDKNQREALIEAIKAFADRIARV